jgi:hypothetical protein
MHGSNLAGVVEILKKNKEREKKNINHTSIHVSWVTKTDKVKSINELMQPKDRGWACGATAGYAAIHYEKPDELFMLGHDLESMTGKLNNVYKDTKHYGLKEAHKTPSVNWIRQWRELMTENPNIQFYKVNPQADSCKDPLSVPVKEWDKLKVKYIDYTTLDKMLKI